jgi:hypothetical protein
MKNLHKKITEFLPASSTKKSVQNFFCSTGKICLSEISLYIQKTGFFSVFADGRIKPWSSNQMIKTSKMAAKMVPAASELCATQILVLCHLGIHHISVTKVTVQRN